MMSLTWYLLGLLTVASGWGLLQLSQRYRLNWLSWSGLLIGVTLILFCIAWSVGSVLEGVPRAAAMGLLFFGLGGIVVLAVTGRYITARMSKKQPATQMIRPAPPVIQARLKTADRAGDLSTLEKNLWIALGRLALISLVLAFFLGMMREGEDYETIIRLKYPEIKLTRINDNPPVFQMGEKIGDMGNYIMIQEGQGYGGPFLIGIRIMDDAKIHEVMLLDNRETPAFIKKVDDARFPEQFVGKPVSDDFIVGRDVDAVSGATVSTRAGTMAIRSGAHIAATQYFKLKPTWQKVPWNLGVGEILIALIFILAFVPSIHQKAPWKQLYMLGSLTIVGFYMNASISVSSLANLAQGYIPPLREHIVWWVLVFGSVLAIVFYGKNVYCYRICPFFWVEWLLAKVGGGKLKMSPALQKRSGYAANFCLWASLMLIFLSGHPGLGSYEPFAMMFSLNGVGVQWYILPLALIGSFFLSTFWCRFFCPVGNTFRHMLSWRRRVLEKFKRRPKSAEA